MEKSRPSSLLHSSTENVFGACAQLPDESEVQDKDKLVNMDSIPRAVSLSSRSATLPLPDSEVKASLSSKKTSSLPRVMGSLSLKGPSWGFRKKSVAADESGFSLLAEGGVFTESKKQDLKKSFIAWIETKKAEISAELQALCEKTFDKLSDDNYEAENKKIERCKIEQSIVEQHIHWSLYQQIDKKCCKMISTLSKEQTIALKSAAKEIKKALIEWLHFGVELKEGVSTFRTLVLTYTNKDPFIKEATKHFNFNLKGNIYLLFLEIFNKQMEMEVNRAMTDFIDIFVTTKQMTGIDGMPCTSSIILQKIDNLWEQHFKQN